MDAIRIIPTKIAPSSIKSIIAYTHSVIQRIIFIFPVMHVIPG